MVWIFGCVWCWSEKWNTDLLKSTTLTLFHSSLVAVEQSVQSGTVVHHKHSSSRPFGGHAAFPLDVQCHLNRQPSIILTPRITSKSKLSSLSPWTETCSKPTGRSRQTQSFLINQISTTPPAWHIQVQTHHSKDDSQDWCGPLTAAQIWPWQRSWPWWCHPTSDLQEEEQVVFHNS